MTKTNTRSRIVSILLVLMMLLTMVPITAVTASAAEPEWTTVNTYEEWKAAMEQSGETYIKLGADIDTSTLNGGFGLGPGAERHSSGSERTQADSAEIQDEWRLLQLSYWGIAW